MCPLHYLSVRCRPLVIPESSNIVVNLPAYARSHARCSFDGKNPLRMRKVRAGWLVGLPICLSVSLSVCLSDCSKQPSSKGCDQSLHTRHAALLALIERVLSSVCTTLVACVQAHLPIHSTHSHLTLNQPFSDWSATHTKPFEVSHRSAYRTLNVITHTHLVSVLPRVHPPTGHVHADHNVAVPTANDQFGHSGQ
jgi:hypothetical protein